MSLPSLSVVVVSFQTRGLLGQCLRSVTSISTDLAIQVVVVDNASTDGTATWVREHFPEVKLIANPVNCGFARASNQGLRVAIGSYLMLLNPDTLVPAATPSAFDTLVGFMEGRPRAGACGPLLRYADGSLQHSAFRFPSLPQVYMDLYKVNWRISSSRLNGRYPLSRYSSKHPFQVDHPLGAAFVVRREAARDVGWLDEDFFIYAEEIDWAWRLRKAGWEIWCVPEAEIIHLAAQSTRQFKDKMFVELWRSRLRLFRKHRSPPFNLAVAVLLRAGMRHAAAGARKAFAQGMISDSELGRQLDAFGQVIELSRRPN